MAAGSIILELLMRTGSFVTDTDRAAKSLKKLQKEADATKAAFKGSFAGNLLADFAQQFGTKLATLPGQVLESVDAFNDLRDATGASVENISAIDRVARETGVGFDVVSSSLIKLNKALGDAKPGSDAEQAIQAIGLNVKELKALDPAEALRRIAVALSGFADDGNKARITQELFGKSLKEVAPLLVDLAKQNELVAKTTTEQAQAVEDFRKLLFGLSAASTDSARALVNDLLPAVNKIIKAFLDGKETGESFFDAIFGQTSQQRLTGRAETLAQDITRATDAVIRMQEEFDRGGGTDTRLAGRIEKARQRIQALQTQAQATRGAIDKLTESRDPLVDPTNFSNEGRNNPKPSVAEIKQKVAVVDPFPALKKAALEMEAVQVAQLNSETDLTDAEKARAKVVADLAEGTLKLKKGEFDLLDAIYARASQAQKDNEQKKLSLKLDQEANDENEKFVENLKDRVAKERDAAAAAQEQLAIFGLSAEAVEKRAIALERERAAGKNAAAQRADNAFQDENARLYRQSADAINAAADARQRLLDQRLQLENDPLTGQTQAVKDYLDEIAKAGLATYDVTRGALQDLEQLAVDGLSGKNIKQQAKALVDKLIAEFLRLQVIRPLMQSLFGASGTDLNALFGAGSQGRTGTGIGGAEGSSFTPAYANGTPYVPRTGLAMLHQGERVLTRRQNAEGSGGGGNTQVIVENHTGQQSRQEESGSGANKMIRVIIGEAAKSVRRGGEMHRAIAGTYGMNRAAGALKRG